MLPWLTMTPWLIYDLNNPSAQNLLSAYDFKDNTFFRPKTTNYINIRLVIKDFPPIDIEFDDSQCDNQENPLTLYIQEDGNVKKSDCN